MSSPSSPLPEISSDFRIKQFIDNKFGSDLSKLSGIEKLYTDLLARQEDLEKQMSVPVGDDVTAALASEGDSGTAYKNAISGVIEQLKRGEYVQSKKDEVLAEIDELLALSEEGATKFLSHDRDIKKLQRYIWWMKYAAKINETSENVQQSIMSDSMTDACSAFKRLVNYHGCLIDKSSKCKNVTLYLHKTIMFWYKILKDKLSRELEEILKSINWPFLQARGPNTIVNDAQLKPEVTRLPLSPQPKLQLLDRRTRLDNVVGNLLNIQLPKHVRCSSNKPTGNGDGKGDENDEINNHKILLPFQIMLRPLRKRFHFHFSGAKETNSMAKPEWYLTQVANWVEFHSGFLENTIQPILDNHKHQYVDALVMFTQGLLQLVTCKLAVDIDTILPSDDIYSHLVDEVLQFDRDLRNSHDIPSSLLQVHGPLNVLVLPKCIDKWLAIEQAWANEKLENLLADENTWKPKFSSLSNLEGDVDESKVPECAESVVTMLLTVTDRYKNLSEWKEKVRFLDLQLSLLDDFRLRITQIIRSIACSASNDQTYAVVNAASYIASMLADWADNLFFLELKHHKEKIRAAEPAPSLTTSDKDNELTGEDETVFDGTISLYKKIYQDGIDSLLHQTLTELKTKSYPYITDSWSSLPEPNEHVTMVVSRTVCPLLGLLQERLVSLEDKLSADIFNKFWRALAEKLDLFLFHEVVVKNTFNTGGAAQLQFDMKRNLFPLFRSLTKKPEGYFKRIKEACLILNLQLGSAMLLKESVVEETNDLAAVRILSEMGINLIKPKDATILLKLRTDWC